MIISNYLLKIILIPIPLVCFHDPPVNTFKQDMMYQTIFLYYFVGLAGLDPTNSNFIPPTVLASVATFALSAVFGISCIIVAYPALSAVAALFAY